jgi:hypothetical protein
VGLTRSPHTQVEPVPRRGLVAYAGSN